MATTFKPPATQRIYDVCVVGSQLGGVVAGALLARRGFRVLHVDHDGTGGSYVDHGYVLPWGPAMLPSPRLLPSAELVLAELGLATDVGRLLEPSEPDLQFLLPKHRIDLGRDAAMLRQELRREWPAEAEAIEAGVGDLAKAFDVAGIFLKQAPPLPPNGFLERRTVSKALKLASAAPGAAGPIDETRPFPQLRDHELVRSLEVAHRFFTYLDGEPSPLSLVRLLGGAFRGTHRLAGGLGALRDLLRKRVAESRGELRGSAGEPVKATAFELDGSRVAAVRLADSPDAYVARAYVAATDAADLRALLPSEFVASKAGRFLGTVRPSRVLLSLNLVVKQGALPPALGDNVFALRDPTGGDGENNAVFLQVLPARRDGGKKSPGELVADERVVCASAFVPAADTSRPALEAAAARVREAVADAIPFFERHLLSESIPMLAGPEGRPSVHPLYRVDGESTLGLTGLPVRGPFKNLFFAGREVLPGLGIEGEFYAGVEAASHVAAALGRKDLLK